MRGRILRAINRLKVLGTNRRVDFVVAGTQKGGTTALDAYLREHPEVGMAERKETHFFCNEKYFRNSHPPYSIYHAYFARVLSRKAIGEASPLYMYWQDAPRRLWEYNPKMKIIVILRNPIERAYSAWNMERDRKADPLSFRDALLKERERRHRAKPLQDPVFSYVAKGFYARQLRRIWELFPRSQTLVIKNEDLREKPLETLNVICRFLGVSPFECIEAREVHSRKYPNPMRRSEKKFLKRMFRPEINRLEQLLGWDCSAWLRGVK